MKKNRISHNPARERYKLNHSFPILGILKQTEDDLSRELPNATWPRDREPSFSQQEERFEFRSLELGCFQSDLDDREFTKLTRSVALQNTFDRLHLTLSELETQRNWKSRNNTGEPSRWNSSRSSDPSLGQRLNSQWSIENSAVWCLGVKTECTEALECVRWRVSWGGARVDASRLSHRVRIGHLKRTRSCASKERNKYLFVGRRPWELLYDSRVDGMCLEQLYAHAAKLPRVFFSPFVFFFFRVE